MVPAVPIVEANTYIVDMEYSPLVGGFSVVFNDGRAAFLTASSLKFDPNVSIHERKNTYWLNPCVNHTILFYIPSFSLPSPLKIEF